MANRFNIDIEKAKKLNKKKRHRSLLSLLVLIAFILTVYVYQNSYILEIIQKEYKSKIDKKIDSGNLLHLGYERYFLISEKAIINIRADGYISKIITLNRNLPNKKITINLNYDLAPLKIDVISEKNHPIFYIDNVKTNATNESLTTAIKPGEHELLITDKYFQNFKKKIIVLPFIGYQEAITLSKSRVKYLFESEPSNASIYINQELIGVTPIEGDMDSQMIIVDILKDDYVSINEVIDLYNENSELKRNYRLSIEDKKIKVNYNPKGGNLFVLGVEVKALDEINIPKIGTTKIRYSYKGYSDAELFIDSNTKQIDLSLVPKYGSIEIKSNVEAQVFINEKLVGNTPFNDKLLARTHNIIVKSQGFASQEIDLDVTSDIEYKYSLNLLTISDQLLKDSEETKIIEGNINLRKFAPKKSLIIGSPRSERGQRANEQLRDVKFSRAFYISNTEISEKQYSMYKKDKGNSKNPITNITWDEAALFCNFLSKKENIEPFYIVRSNKIIGFKYDSIGYRLPSESEWEYVAKLSNKNKQTIFVWGNEYKTEKIIGNIADQNAKNAARSYLSDYDDGYGGISPVGSFPEEPSGLYDMSGNVSEWVHDFHSYEVPDAEKSYLDYMGSKIGSVHTIKGSNFLSSSWTELRVSFKESSDKARPEVGFRIAKYIN